KRSMLAQVTKGGRESNRFYLKRIALGFGRHVPFQDTNDVVAQLLARHVGREIALIRRKRAGGRRGNRERRSSHLQQPDQVVRGHGILWPPAHDHAAMARRWQRRYGSPSGHATARLAPVGGAAWRRPIAASRR